MRSSETKKMATLGMLAAAAFISAVFIKIPVGFLSLEPKDTVLCIAGFLYGPGTALMLSALVSFLEMCTVSSTGFIGFAMNIVSSGTFCVTAAFIYKRSRTLKGAVSGLALGVLMMSCAMLLWNYLLTPLYMHVPRSQVTGMLLTLFLPFNLLKGVLNASLAMLIYKPLSSALRRNGFLPAPEKEGSGALSKSTAAIAAAVLLLAVVGIVLLKTSL